MMKMLQFLSFRKNAWKNFYDLTVCIKTKYFFFVFRNENSFFLIFWFFLNFEENQVFLKADLFLNVKVYSLLLCKFVRKTREGHTNILKCPLNNLNFFNIIILLLNILSWVRANHLGRTQPTRVGLKTTQ